MGTLQVAVRSNEPYRLQCYGFLSAVASIGGLGKYHRYITARYQHLKQL